MSQFGAPRSQWRPWATSMLAGGPTIQLSAGRRHAPLLVLAYVIHLARTHELKKYTALPHWA